MFRFLTLCIITITSFSLFAAGSVRPWMGVHIEQAKIVKGVLITKAVEDTPAFRAGFKKGDIILTVDKTKVFTPKSLIELIINKGVGNSVSISYLESGKTEKTTTLKLEAMPGLVDLLKKSLLGKKAPNFTTNILSKNKSKSYELHKNSKKVKIIEFWATWCGACMQAHPIVSDFAKKHIDKIQVLSISNEPPRKIRKFLAQASKKLNLTDEILFLQGEATTIPKDYNIPALPTFIVLDKNNIARFITVGVGSNLNQAFEEAIKLTK